MVMRTLAALRTILNHQIKITITIDTMLNFDGDFNRHIDVYIFNINIQYTFASTYGVGGSFISGRRSIHQTGQDQLKDQPDE